MDNSLAPVKPKKELTYYEKCILFFFIYAVIGWILETIYCVYELGYFTKRGFLFGPLCPIYGYGAVILLLFLQPVKDNAFKLFFTAAIVFTIFEYLVGYGLESLFLMNFWDYTGQFLNINGRVTLAFCAIWGLFAIVFINYLHPLVEKFVNWVIGKIPSAIPATIVKALVVIFIVDTVLSVIRYLI